MEFNSIDLTFFSAGDVMNTTAGTVEQGAVTNENTGNSRFTKEEVAEQFPGVSTVAMQEGEITNAVAFKTENQLDAYRLIRLDKRIPAHTANLNDDYDRIGSAALQEKKDKKIMEWSAKMIKNTYIRIDDEYKDCNFRLNWIGK